MIFSQDSVDDEEAEVMNKLEDANGEAIVPPKYKPTLTEAQLDTAMELLVHHQKETLNSFKEMMQGKLKENHTCNGEGIVSQGLNEEKKEGENGLLIESNEANNPDEVQGTLTEEQMEIAMKMIVDHQKKTINSLMEILEKKEAQYLNDNSDEDLGTPKKKAKNSHNAEERSNVAIVSPERVSEETSKVSKIEVSVICEHCRETPEI